MKESWNLPQELQEKMKQVELDNNCPACDQREITPDELENDVDMLNPDANSLDRG